MVVHKTEPEIHSAVEKLSIRAKFFPHLSEIAICCWFSWQLVPLLACYIMCGIAFPSPCCLANISPQLSFWYLIKCTLSVHSKKKKNSQSKDHDLFILSILLVYLSMMGVSCLICKWDQSIASSTKSFRSIMSFYRITITCIICELIFLHKSMDTGIISAGIGIPCFTFQ